jgi:hypothetical protein
VRVRWQAGEPAVRLEHGGRVVWLRAAGGRVAVWPGFVAPAYGLRRETNVVTVTTEGDALDWALEFR